MHCKHVPDIIGSALERLHRRIEELEAERDELKADNLKLQGDVRKLQETLAAASLEGFYHRATTAELTRKLSDRDHQLEASRARAAGLQKRVNAGVVAAKGVLLGLGEMVS